MITKDSIEAAYSFFHQKLMIYSRSAMEWQREDIEYAISSYADGMNAELYTALANGNPDFLRTHADFEEQLGSAVDRLEQMMK